MKTLTASNSLSLSEHIRSQGGILDDSPRALLRPPQRSKRIGGSPVLDPSLLGEEMQGIQDKLNTLVIGQPEAIAELVGAYQLIKTNLAAPNRPYGSYLFLGPTGVGKTRLVEALAEVIHGDSGKLLKINCAEFQMDHEVSKLIGSPPGYLGHRETSALLSPIALGNAKSKESGVSIVLFDEIEKASLSLAMILLGILDKAQLSLGDNSKVDFSTSLIILTSNLGEREAKLLSSPWGLVPPPSTGVDQKRNTTNRVVDKFFGMPEFLNRLDKIIHFNPLTREDMSRVGGILEAELRRLGDRLSAPGIHLHPSDGVKAALVEEGFSDKFGARELKRILEVRLMRPIASLLGSGQLQVGDEVNVEVGQGGKFLFSLREG